MKLSTKGRYGTRLLLDIALNQGKAPVLLKDVARRQQIPLPYLKHLVSPLVKGGLLRSTRGARGGFVLARHPEQVKLSEVLEYLEGSLALVDCISKPGVCRRAAFCATRDIWGEMGKAISGVLESVTLLELMERQKSKQPAAAKMYYI
ncbi:MAG: Rrf2 family transcriptional regulator [Chloroflexota bacterium]|nr:Rrf2 family transcriptional regulator [Chloroflexota bacterium]